MSERGWTWNLIPSEVAFGWLDKSRRGHVCLDVLVSCVFVLLLLLLLWDRQCQPLVSDCGLGLTLGQNLSVIVKKNNSAHIPGCRQPQDQTENFRLQRQQQQRTGRGEVSREKMWPRGNTNSEVSPGCPLHHHHTFHHLQDRQEKKEGRGPQGPRQPLLAS